MPKEVHRLLNAEQRYRGERFVMICRQALHVRQSFRQLMRLLELVEPSL